LVEDGYHQNPYHNAVHAADVTQAVNCFMLETKVGAFVCFELVNCMRSALEIISPGGVS